MYVSAYETGFLWLQTLLVSCNLVKGKKSKLREKIYQKGFLFCLRLFYTRQVDSPSSLSCSPSYEFEGSG